MCSLLTIIFVPLLRIMPRHVYLRCLTQLALSSCCFAATGAVMAPTLSFSNFPAGNAGSGFSQLLFNKKTAIDVSFFFRVHND